MRDSSELTKRTAGLSRRSLTRLAIALGAGGAATTLMSAGVSAESGGQRMLLATTTVADFDKWVKTFEGKSLLKRKQHGSTGAAVFRDPMDEARVWVMFEWDEKGWQAFVSDPEVPPIMKEAGHTSKAQAAKFAGRFSA